jgi:hypothetical protein
MPKLNWNVLTRKRGSSTQGPPPGKEDLAWVTNTVTLIYGERDAILVDTNQASCAVTPAACEHAGSALRWLLSYARRSVRQLSSGQFRYHSQPHSHRTESLKLCLVTRRLQIAHALIHITHLTGRARIRPKRFGPLGPLDNDGCDCSHHAHLCCMQSAKKRSYCRRKSKTWKSSRPLVSATKKGR